MIIIIPWRKNYLLNRISTSPQFSERVTQHKTDRMIWSHIRHGDNEEHIRISENDEWNEGRKNDPAQTEFGTPRISPI